MSTFKWLLRPSGKGNVRVSQITDLNPFSQSLTIIEPVGPLPTWGPLEKGSKSRFGEKNTSKFTPIGKIH